VIVLTELLVEKSLNDLSDRLQSIISATVEEALIAMYLAGVSV
jgi:hypothetical protein